MTKLSRSLGYARVSTYRRTLDTQLERLRGAGCRTIYHEKATGAHRRELLKMLDTLAAGDVVTVTRIDRLARSIFNLIGVVGRIVGVKGAIPFATRTVGRHRHQYRALHARGIGVGSGRDRELVGIGERRSTATMSRGRDA